MYITFGYPQHTVIKTRDSELHVIHGPMKQQSIVCLTLYTTNNSQEI